LSSFDDFINQYSNNENVFIFTSLGDIGQPYSCSQWGNQGATGIPLITDDTGLPLFSQFNTDNLLPSTVFIDHNMTVYYQEAGWNSSVASNKVDEMLDNLENSLILAPFIDLSISPSIGDNDGILNPGEALEVTFVISNNSFYLDASNIQATLSDNHGIYWSDNTLSFGSVDVDGSSSVTISGLVEPDAMLGVYNFNLNLSSTYTDLNGVTITEESNFPFNIEISLTQPGFPYDVDSEIRTSPIIVDFDSDGNKDIIFGDNNGYVHVVDRNGNPILEDFFPFDTGNQIWGSPAAGYIDEDEIIDIAITSKSKYLYLFDQNGLKNSFNANQYLIGTPSLANLDNDSDLEIVFGGYSTQAKVFAINLDGSAVNGFPVTIDERMQKGFALYDFNNNGKDDIVLGTDSDNIYLVYDDGSIADGFPFSTGDKIRSAPTVIDDGYEISIVVGSTDENLYVLNSNGSLRFSFNADDEIYASPSFLEYDSEIFIFFGTDNGTVYALDLNGNLHDGFPIYSNNAISDSIVFEDLDSNGIPEIIFSDESGDLYVYESTSADFNDFTLYSSFPASNVFAYSSSVNVADLDDDGDLEIIGGTTEDISVYDIKELSEEGQFWNVYRGNYKRTGEFVYESACSAGDLNSDGILNILDIVRLVNIVVDPSTMTQEEECAADLNSDGIINILDIVTLVNIVVNESN